MKILKLVILLCLLLIPLQAQIIDVRPVIDSIEALPDGTFIFKYGGVEYRGLPPEKMRDVLKTRNERDEYKAEAEQLRQSFEKFRVLHEQEIQQLVSINNEKLASKQKEVEFWKSEFGKQKDVTDLLSMKIRRCSPKFLGFRICTF